MSNIKVSQVDALIERLLHNGNTVKNVVEVEYKNIYKDDLRFSYRIDKENKEVVVTFKTDSTPHKIVYGFPLPVIVITLTPPISYLLFWRKVYLHDMTDTFKLEYSLAMYYLVCLQTYYKNNTEIVIIKPL